jgi:hypothetical protein
MAGKPYPVIRSGIDYDKVKPAKSASLTPASEPRPD